MPDVSLPFTLSNTPPNTQVVDADQLNANFNAIISALNNLDEPNLADALLQRLGLSAGTTGRGYSHITTSEFRTSTSYGFLASPDRVSNVRIPAGGKVRVSFQALWRESVSGAGRAAIFIGANQLKVQEANVGSPVAVAAAASVGAASNDMTLCSHPLGLVSGSEPVAASGADVATGQVIGLAGIGAAGPSPQNGISVEINGTVINLPQGGGGYAAGPCELFGDPNAPMTVDISVQFKSSSGSVTASNRKLWVEVWGP